MAVEKWRWSGGGGPGGDGPGGGQNFANGVETIPVSRLFRKLKKKKKKTALAVLRCVRVPSQVLCGKVSQ